MKKILITLFLFTLLAPAVCLAQEEGIDYKCPHATQKECLEWALEQTGQPAGFDTSQVGTADSGVIAQTIGTIISYILGFLGVIFLVITIISGIQWMTAGGNEEKVTKARTRLINAMVGLVIIMAAYAITWFVVDKLQTATTTTSTISTSSYTSCTNNANCTAPEECCLSQFPGCANNQNRCVQCVTDSDCQNKFPQFPVCNSQNNCVANSP